MQHLQDIYTTYGSSNLYGCWTPNVSKFDPSSFYNWEQDNLPIYDLEERTALLWERLGNPTSSVNGFLMVVSGDATSSCNSNVFTSLSACLQALPEVINAPVVIEVASFGNLGDLVLSNKTCGPRGSIEIINRLFGKAESVASSYTFSQDYKYGSDTYNLVSAVGYDNTSLAGWSIFGNVPSIAFDLSSASSYTISSRICSSITDTRFNNNISVFSRRSTVFNNRLTASIASKNPTVPFANLGSTSKIEFTPYEYNTESWDSISTYDASCIDEINNSEIVWSNNDSTNQEINALAYANKLSSVKIYNCDIPIYIRNFTVDGGGYGGKEIGWDIKNSSVFLENCSVSRCTKAGIQSLNSKLVFLKSFVAYRNYGFDSTGKRQGGTWATKIKTTQANTSSLSYAAGLLAVNSDISFSSTYDRDWQFYQSSMLSYGVWAGAGYPLAAVPQPAFNWLVCFSRNDIGIKSVNSRISGGKNEKYGYAPAAYYNAQNIVVELNSECGVSLDESDFDHSGKLHVYGNFRGIDAKSSNIKLDNVVSKYNQKEGCRLVNSKLKYNKDVYLPYDFQSKNQHQTTFMLNGTHIKLENSIFEPTECSSMPTYYGRFIASGHFGANQSLTNQLGASPAFIVDANSTMRLVHPAIATIDSFTESGKGGYGLGFYVDNGSELVLQGSKSYCTKLIGPSTYALQKRKSGIYANNGSNVKIQGPTVIARYAVDILADNGSKMEFTPHRNKSGQIDVSGWNLTDNGNHTTVELHSTRACVVADNGSFINIEDLGDYRRFWSSGTYGASQLLSGVDYLTQDGSDLAIAPYTSAGSFQFYPNPNDSSHYNSPGVVDPGIGDIYTNTAFTTNAAGYKYLLNQYIGQIASNQNFSSVTVGGMCLRALNGSKVNVDNVHFPCGWWNPSGIIYDVSGPESNVCNRLFIWNIADLSQLDAKLISVSGLHPADAAYFGPSGVWGSASSAPAGTPDTSSVSILDFYGRSTNHPYSRSTAANQGPFRLFFSTDPVINWGVTDQYTLSGYIPQVYSQGYQFSGTIVFPGNVSSLYASIIKQSGSNLVTSGFYYASSMVASPQTVRVVLDESAANTFANAKHNTVGKSGLAKVVAVYLPYTDTYGGDSAKSPVKQYGRGVRSVNTFDLEKDN